MTVFVLTQLERKESRPLAVVSTERAAQQWILKDAGNDYFPLILDEVAALGLEAPPVTPRKTAFRFPTPPDVTGADASTALAQISAYALELISSIEAFTA